MTVVFSIISGKSPRYSIFLSSLSNTCSVSQLIVDTTCCQYNLNTPLWCQLYLIPPPCWHLKGGGSYTNLDTDDLRLHDLTTDQIKDAEMPPGVSSCHRLMDLAKVWTQFVKTTQLFIHYFPLGVGVRTNKTFVPLYYRRFFFFYPYRYFYLIKLSGLCCYMYRCENITHHSIHFSNWPLLHLLCRSLVNKRYDIYCIDLIYIFSFKSFV